MAVQDKKVEQICNDGSLENYREQVEILVKIAREYKFEVATRTDDCTVSNTEWDLRLIRLAAGRRAKKGLPLLFNFLHEIGHVTLGKPSPNLRKEERINREKVAWDKAWELLENKIPSIKDLRDQFNKHRDKCLDSYMKSDC